MNTPVNFELAKLLKEKGFDKPTKQRYFIAENIDSNRFPFLQKECAFHNWNDYDDSSTTYYSAPTIAEAVMWLYEKHEIFIQLFPIGEDSKMKFYSKIIVNDNGWVKIQHQISTIVNSPTEAYEAAIKHCLEKII